MDIEKTLYIGIDPDVDKSGFAIWNKPLKKFVGIHGLSLPDLMRKLSELKSDIAMVVVEGGFLNKSNWHLNYIPKNIKVRNPIAKAAEIGRSAGRNHQRAMDILEILEYMEIPYRVQKPLNRNTWKNDEAMFRRMTGTKGGNPEKRDAAMLVFNI